MNENGSPGGAAVITGAARGLGAGLARVLAARGTPVVIADVLEDALRSVAREIDASGERVLAVPTDVADPAALEHLAAAAYERFGVVSLLVNNAGIERVGLTWEIPAEEWQRAVGVNVMGVIHGVRAFAPRMIAQGTRATIANVASVGALGMMPLQTSYILSKHAVLSFSECLALEMELLQAPIQVSVILPGPVNTAIFQGAVASGSTLEAVTQRHCDIMRGMLAEHGIPPNEAAGRILAGLDAGNFWVTTHPEMLAGMAEERAAHLRLRPRPTLSPHLKALL
jgi:NAD(P)-dependent dehydrogenase (short-subunit alcohol dehydrogenase family)